MDVIECINTRRSIRSFKSKKIDKDDLYLLVEAGMKAPSAGNLQDYRFIVTQKRDIINKVAEYSMEQGWIARATGLIVICSQPKKQVEWYGPKGDHIFAVQNAAAAAQNILLAAHSSGLGACWVSGFDQEAMDELFQTVGKGRVEVVIPVGYPNEEPDDKSELELDAIMYFDKFGNDKSNLLTRHKDYSAIIEKNVRKIPEKSKSLLEKGKYFLKKSVYEVKQKQKEMQKSKEEKKE